VCAGPGGRARTVIAVLLATHRRLGVPAASPRPQYHPGAKSGTDPRRTRLPPRAGRAGRDERK
jgi:hypothetical protein